MFSTPDKRTRTSPGKKKAFPTIPEAPFSLRMDSRGLEPPDVLMLPWILPPEPGFEPSTRQKKALEMVLKGLLREGFHR
jgi:hypothetical protein